MLLNSAKICIMFKKHTLQLVKHLKKLSNLTPKENLLIIHLNPLHLAIPVTVNMTAIATVKMIHDILQKLKQSPLNKSLKKQSQNVSLLRKLKKQS